MWDRSNQKREKRMGTKVSGFFGCVNGKKEEEMIESCGDPCYRRENVKERS